MSFFKNRKGDVGGKCAMGELRGPFHFLVSLSTSFIFILFSLQRHSCLHVVKVLLYGPAVFGELRLQCGNTNGWDGRKVEEVCARGKKGQKAT